MMNSVMPPRRPIVLKTSRDTLMLLGAASALTFGIAYSVHSHPAPVASERPASVGASGQWAGQLAELSPNQAAAPASTEPLSSAALTVPKAAMALPVAPRSVASPAKPRTCDGGPCPPQAKASTSPVSAASTRRTVSATTSTRVREASLVERLNPFTHLPDAVRRPIASAGDTIAGWVKRF